MKYFQNNDFVIDENKRICFYYSKADTWERENIPRYLVCSGGGLPELTHKRLLREIKIEEFIAEHFEDFL